MKAKRKQRLMFVLFLISGIAIAAALALTAFQDNMLYFYKPSEVLAGEAPSNRAFRIGGIVVKDSIKRRQGNLRVQFTLTDYVKSIPVFYDGILPDLFREEQGIIALGRLNGEGLFIAEEVLAKHDENYMPPEVAEMLNQNKKQAREQIKP